MRARIALVALAAVIIVTLIVLGVADTFLVDFLWFGSLGYRAVFDRIVGAQVTIFAGVWLFGFVAIAASGFAAIGPARSSERLRVVRRPDQMVEVNLPELIRAFSDRIPWRLLVLVGAAVLAIFPASGEAGGWDIYLKAHSWRAISRQRSFLRVRCGILRLHVATAGKFSRPLPGDSVPRRRGRNRNSMGARGLDFRESPPRISPGAAAHISVILGIFFVQRAFSYWLSRYGLLYHTNGVVYGMRYVDHVLWRRVYGCWSRSPSVPRRCASPMSGSMGCGCP